MSEQVVKAEKLRQLHHGPKILVLPNAWDAASARIFEDAGFPAIATTSAGVAFSLGYPDGQLIPRHGPKLFSIEQQTEKIRTVRRVSDKLGVRLVINARTDQYLAEIGEPSTRFAEACK